MAEPVSKLVLSVIKHDCPMDSCPYRYANEQFQKRLDEKLDKKLKHRVSDGNQVRALERRVKELEKELLQVKAELLAAKKNSQKR
jgi:hypothetical protein